MEHVASITTTGDSFWHEILLVPKVQESLYDEIVRSLAAKVFPGNIDTTTAVYWTMLTPKAQAAGSHCLVSVALAKGTESGGIPALHVVARSLAISSSLRLAARTRCVVVSSGGAYLISCAPGEASLTRFSGEQDLEAFLGTERTTGVYVDDRDGPVPRMEIPTSVEPRSIAELRVPLDPGFFKKSRSSGVITIVIPAVVCALLLLATAVVVYASKSHALSELEATSAKLRVEMGALEGDLARKTDLEATVDRLAGAVPVGLYSLLGRIAALYAKGDTILGISYQDATRFLSIRSQSSDSIALIRRLSQSGLFTNLNISGMIAVEGKPGMTQFQWSGEILP